ncbi:MAG: DUF4091 domain-containing protein [Bacteroidales bacterium]|nr:DUF4091 domain-containing protein [Bacteroidales bacterium]MDY6002302.1 DUF4091 domain-containing protein [Candidatus Cryptobacteroides sp.]
MTLFSTLLLASRLLTLLHLAGDELKLYQVDPLQKVFKETVYLVDQVDTIRAACGEYATVQIVMKARQEIRDIGLKVVGIQSETGARLEGATVGWVGYVPIGRSYSDPAPDIIRTLSGYFPDPILTDSLFTAEAGEVQPLWITIPVNAIATPGLYAGKIEITGKIKQRTHTWNKTFYIRVYPVRLGKSPLLMTNWSSHFDSSSMRFLNNGQPVERYSPLYWDLISLYAKTMSEHRQNVFRIFPTWHTLYTLDADGKYTFDFSRFDREVEIYEKEGALRLIEGGHLAWRSGTWNSDFYVEVPLRDDEESHSLHASPCPQKVENGLRFVILPVNDPRAKNFLTQFLPALRSHLSEKGWLDKYVQHIGDEPTAQNAESYAKISTYIRKYMPGVRLIDAVLASKELAGTIDIWVPVLQVLHHNQGFFQDLKKQGKEVWYYTCTNPRGNYANRFIELPLIKTRYLHWINFKYDLPGFLHWGLNFWNDDPFHSTASRDAGKLPAGDHAIIYPGYRKIYSSIRYEAERDGIDDYQLLRMLEKKDPAKAYALANGLIMNYDNYDTSIPFFRKTRKELLEALSY